MGEIIFLLLLAAIGGYYYYESLGYTVGRFDTTGGGGLFPRAILIVLFVLLAARLIEILVKKEKAPFKFFGYLKGVGGVFFISFVLFVLLIKPLGFVVDAVIFALFTVNFLYYKAKDDKKLGGTKAIIIRTVCIIGYVILVNWFFTGVLHVNLPAGVLKNIL